MTHIFQNIPKSSDQVLTNNELDKEVQRIAKSLNFAFHLFFSSKYCVKRNRIYPIGNKYLLYSFSLILFINALCIYRALTIDISDGKMRHFENFFIRIFCVIYYIDHVVNFINLFILDFVHRNNYVTLILRIQSIHKDIDFNKNIGSYIIWNLISILTTIFCDVFIYGIYCVFFSNINLVELIIDVICDAMYTAFDLKYVVAMLFIILLKNYLEEWIKDILMLHNSSENNEKCTKLHRTYQNIITAYNLYKTIFQISVSF